MVNFYVYRISSPCSCNARPQTDIFLSGMVLCLKSAEALSHLIVGGSLDQIEWFPSSFLISEGRMNKGKFEGRRDMKP